MTTRSELFVCECGTMDHNLVVQVDDYEDGFPPNLIIYTNLHPFNGFWRRVWNAIKYVCGKKADYGHFDVTIIKPDDLPRLKELIGHYESQILLKSN